MTEADQLAQEVFQRMMQTDYCSQWMGIEALEIKHNYCKLKMTVRKEMLNGYGILHGGIAFAFADSAFAFASNSEGRISVSINGSMNYHKSATEGSEIIAEAKCLNLSYKTGDYDVNIYNLDQELLYSFRGTVYRKSELVLEHKN